jgi:flagellar protein FlaG
MTSVSPLGTAAAFAAPPASPPPPSPAAEPPEIVGAKRYEAPRDPEVRGGRTPERPSIQEIVTELSRDEVETTVERLNEVLQELGHRLAFDLYEGTDEFYAMLIDRRTRETVKTIPPEDILKFHAKLQEFVGALLDERV